MRRFASLFLALFLTVVPAAASAFSVSPGTADLRLEAGQGDTRELVLTNTSPQAETYYLRTVPFQVEEGAAGPVFGGEDPLGVAGWLRVPPSVRVEAGARETVSVQVAVPPAVPPGGYYAAVLVSPTPSEVVAVAGGAGVQATIAVPFYLAVGGMGVERVGLLSFGPTDGKQVTDGLWGFYEFQLQNQGTVHVVPEGSITVRDVFGRRMAEGPANPKELRIMPGQTRAFSEGLVLERPPTFWDVVKAQGRYFALGPVTVELALEQGPTPEQPVNASYRLWVLPWQLAAVVVGGVAVLYGVLRLLTRRHPV